MPNSVLTLPRLSEFLDSNVTKMAIALERPPDMKLTQLPKPSTDDASQAVHVLAVLKDYQAAAAFLMKSPLKESGPCRFFMLHATELYLNAFLYAHGESVETIRDFQHSFTRRIEAAGKCGLVLRKKTVEHLQKVDARKEYVNSRYQSVVTEKFSLSNRLTASLNEVAKKVTKGIEARVDVAPIPEVAKKTVPAQRPKINSA